MTNRVRWASALAFTAAGSLAATYAFSNANWQTPWQRIVGQTLSNMLFSGCCVAICLFVLPVIRPLTRRWLPFPADWVATIVALIACGVAGSVVSTTIAVALGLMPAKLFFRNLYAIARVSVYFTLIFGISGTAIGELRARLASTKVALRTKERDEADARRLMAEAQLASLESRVDPHFLFNTLNSIAALVRDNPAAAERVIEQLASLMRSSLDRRASLVTLDEELTVVRSYLEIERVRFGDRLRYELSIDERAARTLVPRLSLQTLVENSVKHAVSSRQKGASIVVRAAVSDGRTRIEVEDDGPGFDGVNLPEGHGLALLRARLQMQFGTHATMGIDSGPGRTCIWLDVPLDRQAEAPPQAAAEPPARGSA